MEHHDVLRERARLVREEVGDQPELLVDVRGVADGPDVPLLVVEVEVPAEEHGGAELLDLDADVHADGDDVVVEDQPHQEDVEAGLEVLFVGLTQVPVVVHV